MPVIIYSTTWCHFCKEAKKFLDQQGVKYTEINVENDQEKAKEMVEKSGQMGVPVLDINGTIIVGFDREKMKKALGLK